MGNRSKKIVTLGVFAAILAATLAEPQPSHAAPRTAPIASDAPAQIAPTPVAPPDAAPELEAEAQEARTLRRLRGSEMSVPLVKKAREIINEHYKKPFGTDIEFELDGKRYVGRIEQHYHPPGGELRPWGHHAGCSLFLVEG